MAKQLQFRRLLALTLLLAAAFAGLGYRLVDLQVVRHGELAREARSNTQYSCPLTPRRGDILDINGGFLATSVFVKTVCADPTLLGNYQAQVAQAIAPLLQTNAIALEKLSGLLRAGSRIRRAKPTPSNMSASRPRSPARPGKKSRTRWRMCCSAWTKRTCPRKTKAFYANLRKKAIFTDPVDDQLRNYPNGTLAAHVVGFMGIERPDQQRQSRASDGRAWMASRRNLTRSCAAWAACA